MSQGCSEYYQVSISQALWFHRQRLCKYKVWLSNPTAFWRVTQDDNRGGREAPASIATLSGAKPPPRDIHAGPDRCGLCCVWLSAALFPYIVNEEGIPLCARFQSTFQNSIGKEADFQLWLIGLDTTGPDTVLGSWPSLFQDVSGCGWKRKPP